jgi:hypothetical protein
VLERILRHNEQHAVRSDDVIDVEERKPTKVKGKGAFKQWLPQALQRVCWGARPRILHKKFRLSSRQSRPCYRSVAPVANSTNTWASFMQGSSAHVQQIRNAMSEHVLQLQIGAVNIMEKPKYMFLEIAFDETETPMRLELNGEAVRRPAGARFD